MVEHTMNNIDEISGPGLRDASLRDCKGAAPTLTRFERCRDRAQEGERMATVNFVNFGASSPDKLGIVRDLSATARALANPK